MIDKELCIKEMEILIGEGYPVQYIEQILDKVLFEWIEYKINDEGSYACKEDTRTMITIKAVRDMFKNLAKVEPIK